MPKPIKALSRRAAIGFCASLPALPSVPGYATASETVVIGPGEHRDVALVDRNVHVLAGAVFAGRVCIKRCRVRLDEPLDISRVDGGELSHNRFLFAPAVIRLPRAGGVYHAPPR